MNEQEMNKLKNRMTEQALKFFSATSLHIDDPSIGLFVAMLMAAYHEGACDATDKALEILHSTKINLRVAE